MKADNIVVPAATGDEPPRVVLVDIPDLSADGDEGITIGAVPHAVEGESPLHRDAFAVCALVLGLLLEEFTATRSDVARAIDLVDVLPPLDLLAETLQDELHPRRPLTACRASRRSRSVKAAPSLSC